MEERRQILNLLDEYDPIDEGELKTKFKIIDFVNDNRDCFFRTNASGHVTGSCWLVDNNGQDVLLTHHKKLNKWVQLGGHADGNPNILDVAMREAREESGIGGIVAIDGRIFDVDIHHIPQHKDVGPHFHYDIRFALSAPHRIFDVSHESHALAWVSIEELASASNNRSLKRMAKKWIDRFFKARFDRW